MGYKLFILFFVVLLVLKSKLIWILFWVINRKKKNVFIFVLDKDDDVVVYFS